MIESNLKQMELFELTKTRIFPSTRYQGSKLKLSKWISNCISDLNFHSCLDAFGGTGAIAYELKKQNKKVVYNDVLRFNYYFGKALIENKKVTLTIEDIEWILTRHSHINYPNFISKTFHDIYFTPDENEWLDQTITNINLLGNPYKNALAFFALSQSCIVKRPYNLFHRKNLYMRFSDVKRSFGNKTSWDKPFQEWFIKFCDEANNAVFDNGFANSALNLDAIEIENNYDLIYIDTPYISNKGIGVDYRDFYHFLEGLSEYSTWHNRVDFDSKHRRLIKYPNSWTNKNHIFNAFENLFEHFKDSTLVISYRSDGIPSENELISILKKYKKDVTCMQYGKYKYALSNNSKSRELLLIGTD